MSRHQRRFDTKQVICTIIGGVFGVGLIFLIGIHVGKQVGGADAIEFQTSSHEVPTGAVASATNQIEPDYHFFELLEAPAPQRELPEVELALNPVLEEREKKKEERLQKARERRKKARDKKAESPKKEAGKPNQERKQEARQQAVTKEEDAKPRKPKADKEPAEKTAREEPTEIAKTGGTASPASVAIAAQKEDKEKEDKEKKEEEKKAKPSRKYTVQVSAFPEEDAARKLAAQLAGKGYKARVTAEEVPGKGTWYRVRVGAFTSRDDADGAKRNIKSKAGLSGFVTAL